MKISNNNFNHHYYVAKDKKSDDKTVADEKTDNNKPPDDEKIDNRSSLDYLINKDRDRARALLKQQDKPKIRNKRDSNDPNIITVIANKQPEWLSSRESSYASDSLQQAILASKKQAERSTSAAINDDLVKILINEQHARSLLKKANSLAIIGGAVTPAGQMAPVFSSSGVGSLVFNNSTGVSLITQLNQVSPIMQN